MTGKSIPVCKYDEVHSCAWDQTKVDPHGCAACMADAILVELAVGKVGLVGYNFHMLLLVMKDLGWKVPPPMERKVADGIVR